jgi:hypothetical protein
MRPLNILIGGDLCPTPHNEWAFRAGDAQTLLSDMLPIFQEADLRIVNLECPLTDIDSPILKSGPALRAHPQCARGLKAMGIDLVNLANNHVLDHGPQGLESTIRVCREQEIDIVGAGPTLEDARQPWMREIENRKIFVVSMAEHEGSTSRENAWGANPLDILTFVRRIPQWREQADLLIVVLHGGVEHYPYPPPELREICRFFIEQGAHLVVVQHQHCVCCTENYPPGMIIYGQGNLIFDYPSKRSTWFEGLLLKVELLEKGIIRTSYIPYGQSAGYVGIRPLPDDRSRELLEGFHRRSQEILDPKRVHTLWQKHCQKSSAIYLSALRGHGRLRYILNRLFRFSEHCSSPAKLATICNIIRCESHREAIINCLETIIENKS